MIQEKPKYYCLYSVEDLSMKSLFSSNVVNIRIFLSAYNLVSEGLRLLV